MESFKLLGRVDCTNTNHLREIDFSGVVKSSYAPTRTEKWYGYSSNLQSIKDNRVEVKWVQDFPDWIKDLKMKYFPESDSCLVCKGSRREGSDTSIDWHRDHGTFENKVVMVNYGLAHFFLNSYEDIKMIPLDDGDVVEFDSKLPHKSIQVCDERYIVTFRKTKREYLAHKLF